LNLFHYLLQLQSFEAKCVQLSCFQGVGLFALNFCLDKVIACQPFGYSSNHATCQAFAYSVLGYCEILSGIFAATFLINY